MPGATLPSDPAPIGELVDRIISSDTVEPGTRLGKGAVPVRLTAAQPGHAGQGFIPAEMRSRPVLPILVATGVAILVLGTAGLMFGLRRSSPESLSTTAATARSVAPGTACVGDDPGCAGTSDSSGSQSTLAAQTCAAGAPGCDPATTGTICPAGDPACNEQSTTAPTNDSTTQCPAAAPGCADPGATPTAPASTTTVCPPGTPGCATPTSTIGPTTATTPCRIGTPGCGPPTTTTTTTTAPPCAPRLASITPASGGSGQSVTITGCGFTGATRVTFSNVATGQVLDAGSVTVVTDTRITAVAPGFPPGSRFFYDVQVVTPRGTTPLSPAGSFQGG